MTKNLRLSVRGIWPKSMLTDAKSLGLKVIVLLGGKAQLLAIPSMCFMKFLLPKSMRYFLSVARLA